MKLSLKGLTGAATMLAAALGLNLLGPHRAYAAPGTLAVPGESDLGVTILSPDPHVALSGLKPVEISAFYQGSPGNQIVSVELYLDGVKAATKTLDVPETRGVVSFLVDAAQLSAGTHKVVVRATAADEEVKSAKTVFTFGDTDRGDDRLSQPSPALALPPQVGGSAGSGAAPTLRLQDPTQDGKVSGTVTLRVNATDPSGKAPYVSLFIDKTFKTLRNFAPYEFEWDTTAYTNGYHEIEVDGYNDGPNIGHSKTLRVLVQNEGGNTSIRHDLLDGVPIGAIQGEVKNNILTPRTDGVAPARRAAPVRRALRTPRATPRRVSRAPQKSLGRPLPMRRPDALLALDTPSRSSQTRDILRQMAKAGGESLHFGTLGFASDLSSPFVAERPAAPTATPTRGFKPLPASRPAASSPSPDSAKLAAVPARAGSRTARPQQLAALRLPSADLASPFLVAPRVGPLSQKPVVKIGAYRAEMRTAASLKPALKMHPLRVHFPASLGSLLRSVGQNSVLFDHATVQLDRPISAENGIVFGPLRQIFEQSGGTLTWQPRTGTVHAKNARKDITVTIGRSQAMVNMRPVLLDGKPYLMTGRTMVPLSFVSTALDADVQYDAASGHLVITSRK